MLIAFEGPDETGKTTSATNLSYNGQPVYNANVDNYKAVKADLANEPEVVQTFDRIDWLTHLIYRITLPEFEWNDARVRTVFGMPDVHLVLKTHALNVECNVVSRVEAIGEGYEEGDLDKVTQSYFYLMDYITGMNHRRDFNLFKTVSVMEVHNDPETKEYRQRLVIFSAPGQIAEGYDFEKVQDDESLLALLRYADARIG